MFRRATFLRETHPYATVLEEEEEDEEGLFKADAVNEEDSERDRATTNTTGIEPRPSTPYVCRCRVEGGPSGPALEGNMW